ncbi:MAG: hypothetical protein EBX52_02765, partial [Proteobacteria bacterium]|nr:hypothetical protein [Pseudomonadota bacterium]
GHVAEQALASEVIAAPGVQGMISKILAKVPPKFKAKVAEQLEHRVQHSIKDASGEFAKLDNKFLDSNGSLTPQGAAIFANTFVKKFTGDLVSLDVATEKKVHEGGKDEDYLRLMDDAMDSYHQQFKSSDIQIPASAHS